MRFRVCNKNDIIIDKRDVIRLLIGNEDDSGFQTSFIAYYYDILSREKYLGPIKIGSEGMGLGQIAERLPKDFVRLPDTYFTLGQDDAFYYNISKLGDNKRVEILSALRDVAYDENLFALYRTDKVMKDSLMRNISLFTVEGQFRRLAKGGRRLTKYRFSYMVPSDNTVDSFHRPCMEFEVIPESNPPTNLHVMIGSNGCGKTYILKDMIHNIQIEGNAWRIYDDPDENYVSKSLGFANVVCIAFSPFDDFSELKVEGSALPWAFIGLSKSSDNLQQDIAKKFIDAFSSCMLVSWKRRLWRESMMILKCDPIFSDEKIEAFADLMENTSDKDLINRKIDELTDVFLHLSSGHKVVLLILTGCVDKIEERSIVFVDEPENHLHPPLLSALIRALSNILIDRNGVAIISTHSPIVLQEVPSSCVWLLNRSGQTLKAERLPVQTFGENIGMLMNSVFGLQVTQSGFHKMLCEAVRKLNADDREIGKNMECLSEYDRITQTFGNQLGNEADILLRTLLALRKKDEQI